MLYVNTFNWIEGSWSKVLRKPTQLNESIWQRALALLWGHVAYKKLNPHFWDFVSIYLNMHNAACTKVCKN